MTLVLVCLAGAAGALARLLLGGWVSGRLGTAAFPWGTFLINMLGSFLLGLLTGLVLGRGALSPQVRTVVGTGFLGAFTTFSTWQWEMFRTYRQGARQVAWANLLASTAAGLLAAGLGLRLGWRP